jgi:hypothetical protein
VNPPAVAIGPHSSILDRLADPAVRLVIWDRPNPARMEGFPESAHPTADELCCLPDWLIEDIGVVGDLYARATGGAWRVRLETATERTCPRFHEDANTLRFLVTYRGPGTEWTTDPEAGVVGTAPTGALVALKGSAWPRSAQAVLHRSAKASPRRPRWVMVLDPRQ